MKHIGIKSLIGVFIVIVLIFAWAVSFGLVHAEEEEEPVYIPLYVTCNSLNCRQSPRNQWVEIHHPEFGNRNRI